jgi:hypothetical protein
VTDDDPTIEEVRRIRREHAARFDFDPQAIFADLKRSEAERDAERSPLVGRRGTLADFFAESPLRDSGLTLERPQDGPREIDLPQSPVGGRSSSKRS